MSRQLIPVLGNSQRLDGGAMFGNAPKVMWQSWITPDEENRIPLACRCLLLRDGDRNVLFEAGIGAFFPPALRERYGVMESEHVLIKSLAAHGVAPADIDTVVLSHLHFDHAGGLLAAFSDGKRAELVFPKARFVVSTEAWKRAQNPHPRDRASFIPELLPLLAHSERLVLVDTERCDELPDGIRFHYSHGHTPGLLLAEIEADQGDVVFAADLIPGHAWVHVPITMGYDRFPERLIEEKLSLLTDLAKRSARLFFTHDPHVAFARVSVGDRGRFVAEPLP